MTSTLGDLARQLENENIAQAYDMGRDAERAAVVAWLRAKAIKDENGGIPWDDCELRLCANAIQRGEHRREEGT